MQKHGTSNFRPIADSRDGSALQCSIHQTCRSIIGAAFSLAGRRLSGTKLVFAARARTAAIGASHPQKPSIAAVRAALGELRDAQGCCLSRARVQSHANLLAWRGSLLLRRAMRLAFSMRVSFRESWALAPIAHHRAADRKHFS